MRDKEIVRKRVAAYCRVSTDGEEQLNSFSSQVKYYTELIEKEPDWMMAGVYADEAITGTQVSKREGFQKMIKACIRVIVWMQRLQKIILISQKRLLSF